MLFANDLFSALTRSHTHGSFARQKTVEEGSEEWWASEKAKKLSPKRFDAGDIKFKKVSLILLSKTIYQFTSVTIVVNVLKF